jgi:hypothetical protein
MSETKSIVCDSCGENRIIDSMYPATYTLELTAVNTGINTAGATYMVSRHPPVDGKLHFCNFKCLAEWANKKVAK